MKVQELFNKRNMYEIGLLFSYVITILVLNVLHKSLLSIILSFIFILGLFVYLCFNYKHFSINNKQGEKSLLFFIVLLYTKMNVLGHFMLEYSFPWGTEYLKVVEILYPAILLLGCIIVICCKHSWKELMNILVYFVPLLLCLF